VNNPVYEMYQTFKMGHYVQCMHNVGSDINHRKTALCIRLIRVDEKEGRT
jgi:hypothetical protein